MLKVIVVDDEAKARRSLVLLLEKIGNIQVIAEASNGQEAISAIASHQPDIVFLDVKMPRMSGFELLDSIDRIVLRTFDVVFLTAFDEFAIQAIKYSAFDYLLKPVDETELRDTLIRFMANNRSVQDYDALKAALSQNVKMKIKSALGYDYVDALDVVYIEGDGNYSKLVLSSNDVRTVSRTLKDIGSELPDAFIRVHKKYFINRNFLLSCNRIKHECVLEKNSEQYKIPVSVRMMKNVK